MSGSLAQIVICDEIVSWIQHCLAPTRIDEETVPLDLIDEKGPDGMYIDCDHTLRHMRDQWYPTIFERGNYSQWIQAGGQTLGERAVTKVEEILAQGVAKPLPPSLEHALDEVISRAEEQARKR
jgi:trimethylamine--corrinoid protein Co-methyltransferase